jgi:hypothetical protein
VKNLLIIWLKLKCWFSRRMGWIGDIHCETSFVACNFPGIPDMEAMDKKGIVYKPDRLFWLIPFDWQFDSVTVQKKGGGDCNSLNRIVQVACHLSGMEAYLVTYIAKPFSKSHGTCIARDRKTGYWWLMDYGIRQLRSDSLEDCARKCAEIYASKMVCFVAQDINWVITAVG